MADRGCYAHLVMEKLGGPDGNPDLRKYVQRLELENDLVKAIKKYKESQPKKRAK